MSDLLEQLNTFEILEYWKGQVADKDSQIKNICTERDSLLCKMSDKISQLETQLKEMQTEIDRRGDLLSRLQNFFGINRDIYYRDIDGQLYPLNNEEINKILSRNIFN